jgi:hypothetical protein
MIATTTAEATRDATPWHGLTADEACARRGDAR